MVLKLSFFKHYTNEFIKVHKVEINFETYLFLESLGDRELASLRL